MDSESYPNEEPQQIDEQTQIKLDCEQYLKRNKIERCQYNTIQLIYFMMCLFFGCLFIMDLSIQTENKNQTKLNQGLNFYTIQMLFFIILMISQSTRHFLRNRNYDFFHKTQPKILLSAFALFFFLYNILLLVLFFANIALQDTKLKSELGNIQSYISVDQYLIPCSILLGLEVFYGFYNQILLVSMLNLRMQNNLINRLLISSQQISLNHPFLSNNNIIRNSNQNNNINILSSQDEQQVNTGIFQNILDQNENTNHTNNNIDTLESRRQSLLQILNGELACNIVKKIENKQDIENNNNKDQQTKIEDEEQCCCSICHSDIEMQQKVIQLPCKHYYHYDCLFVWLINHNTCPLCRNVI